MKNQGDGPSDEDLGEVDRIAAAQHDRMLASQPATKQLPLESIKDEHLRLLLSQVGIHHRFEGASLAQSTPLLATQRTPSKTLQPVFVAYGWDAPLGGSLTITLFTQKGERSGICVCRQDPALPLLESGRFILICVNKGRPWAAFDVDYNHNHESKCYWDEQFERTRNHQGIYPDLKAQFWQTLAHRGFDNELDEWDELSIGWAKRFTSDVERLSEALTDIKAQGFIGHVESSPESPTAEVANVLKIMQDCDFQPKTLLDYFRSEIGDDTEKISKLIKNWPCPDGLKDPDETWASLPTAIWNCALLNPTSTECGRLLPWMLMPRGIVSRQLIQPDRFPENVNPREYWNNLPWGPRPAWGQLLAPADYQVGSTRLDQLWKKMPRVEQVEESEIFAQHLLVEARSDKRGTIPPKSLVQIAIGPFTHVEFTEIHDVVYNVLRLESGEFLVFELHPNSCSWGIHLPPYSRDISDSDVKTIVTALAVVLSAILRDFWVVERRDTVFSTQRTRNPFQSGNKGDEEPRIVYLPRVRYQKSPDTQKASQMLDYPEKRPHEVVGHARKLSDGYAASDHQLTLAKRYGIIVPEGYTFVRPYETGGSQRAVIYRSRSALKTLFTVVKEEPINSGTKNLWFQFEKDVNDLMKALGFEVQHIAASNFADNGVDIYATKGAGIELINWVIQCKCWSKSKVGPSIVRGVIGSLDGYSRGTRGMIVTTSGFTSGAVKLAAESDIHLIDGKEFVRLIEEVNIKTS
jgi:hypothetical protein